jgi:hypothetical protein
LIRYLIFALVKSRNWPGRIEINSVWSNAKIRATCEKLGEAERRKGSLMLTLRTSYHCF